MLFGTVCVIALLGKVFKSKVFILGSTCG